MARALLDAGLDVNVPTAGDRSTPMVVAIINGQYDLALTFLNLSVYVTNTMSPADPSEEPDVTLLSVPIFHVAGITPIVIHDDNGVAIDYSCRVGSCGTCVVKLLSGTVSMEVEDGLEPEDKEAGMVLACQAKAAADIAVDA